MLNKNMGLIFVLNVTCKIQGAALKKKLNRYTAFSSDDVHSSYLQNIQVHHQICESGLSKRVDNTVQHNQTRPNLTYILQLWKLPTHNLQPINTPTIELPLFMPEITLPTSHTPLWTTVPASVAAYRVAGGGGGQAQAEGRLTSWRGAATCLMGA